MTERGILCGYLTPHIPAAARLDFGVEISGSILGAERRIFNATSVGDKYKVIFGKVYGILLAVMKQDYLFCLLFLGSNIKLNIYNFGIIMELHSEAFQIFYHGEYHRFILIVPCKSQRLEIGQTAYMMNITLDIQLHFKCAVPVFKGEHCAPVEPKV